jgi:hypothetical protein
MRHPVVVWVSLPPGVDVIAVLIEQDRIVFVAIVDGVAVFRSRQGFEVNLWHHSTVSRVSAERSALVAVDLNCR